MSDHHPAEPFPLPYQPMMRPPDHLEPDIDQADSLPPNTLLNELRTQNRVLKAAVAKLTHDMGRVTVELVTFAVDQGNVLVDVVQMPGGWRVRVNR